MLKSITKAQKLKLMGSKYFKITLLSILGAVCCFSSTYAEKLVILHTNDTHSSIEPSAEGVGGVLQRKVLIDSIRNAEKNVILVDAGDVVQGTTYFNYFNGDVEYPLMDMMGYQIRVLGNHEFDNGMESLANHYRKLKGEALSANYDFSGTPLEGVFKPYTIKKFGGKKIGFIGLNIDPSSIIAQKNFTGKFHDILPLANDLAAYLKNVKKCDLVVVISHIGYSKVNDKTSDIDLAQSSKDIDLIIGGHTHTLILPEDPESVPSLIENADGKNVRVVQTGKQGKFLGKVTIDLNSLPGISGEDIQYELIPVTDRFPEEKFDKKMVDFLQPFKNAVDSVNKVVIGYSAYELPKIQTGGLPNFTADVAFDFGNHIVDSLQNNGWDIPDLDMAIMNVGGIRHHMPMGPITEGQILSTYPFSNHVVIISIKGKDIIDALKTSAAKGGEAISRNVRVVTDANGNLKRVVLNGKEMDPEKEYILCTIDYLAEGNDDLVSLANNKRLWSSEEEVSVPILLWIKNHNKLGLKVAPDMGSRFVVDVADQLTNSQ